MELQLGLDKKPTESLGVRFKWATGTGDIVVEVCYMPPDQEGQVDDALCRQIGAYSQALVLMGNFSHPDICWSDNTAGHKQSRRFLDCIDNIFLQVIEAPTRSSAILDLVLTKKEGLVGNGKLKGSHGCSDYEMVEFKILRARILTALHFRRAEFGLSMDLLGRVPRDNALE